MDIVGSVCGLKWISEWMTERMNEWVNIKSSGSSQDGGIGRHTSLPHTTKRRITTILKTKTNQDCQKNKLYWSPTTKKLKKKHSSRLVGRAEKESPAETMCNKAVAGGLGRHRGGWQTVISYIHEQIRQEEQLGSKTDHATQGSSAGN